MAEAILQGTVPQGTVPHQRPSINTFLVALVIGVSLATLCLLSSGQYKILLIPAGLALVVVLVLALPAIYRRSDWLIAAVTLLYLLISASFLTEQVRGVVHYGLLALFCCPLLPGLFRSKDLYQGSFKLYCVYFAWAGVTIAFSLAPLFSLGRLFGGLLGFATITAAVRNVEDDSDVHRLLYYFFLPCALIVITNLLAALALPASITWATPAESYDPKYLASLHEAGVSIGGMYRFRGIMGNPNDIGALMLATSTAALACWKLATTAQRAFMAAVIMIALVLVFEADSRSPIVSLAIGCGLYVVWRYRVRGLISLTLLGLVFLAAAIASHGLGFILERDVATLTGRTDIWAFAIQKVSERPLVGYGYDVSGAIFDTRYFPLWYGPWDLGPHSSLHDGYLNRMVGVGAPATLLWIYITARSWSSAFRQPLDPWNLKLIALIVAVPFLILNLTEATLGDFNSYASLLFGLAWALAEKHRLKILREIETAADKRIDDGPPSLLAVR